MKKKINQAIIQISHLFGRGFIAGIGLALGVLGTTLVAQTVTSWTDGQTLNATDLNNVVNDINTLFGDARWILTGADASYSAGYVGLNIATPGARLSIQQAGATSADGIRIVNGGTTWNIYSDGAGRLRFESSGGSNFVLQDDGKVGVATNPSWQLDVRDSAIADGGTFASFGEGSHPGGGGAKFRFYNMGGGGNQRVGFSLQRAGTDYHFWVDDAANFRGQAVTAPTAATNGGIIGVIPSTREAKQNIQPFHDTAALLELLTSVQLRTYYYKNEVEGYKKHAKRKLGFIAEEVDPLFLLEFKRSIDQGSVNGILIGAIQEQQKRILALKASLKEREKQNRQLQKRFSQIERKIAEIKAVQKLRRKSS